MMILGTLDDAGVRQRRQRRLKRRVYRSKVSVNSVVKHE